MHQRAALGAGEDGLVELLAQLPVPAENHASPGSPQGLVGGGGDHVGVGHRVLMHPGGHQAGDVGHVHKEVGPHTLGNLGKAGEVDGSGVGGGAGDDHFGFLLPGQLLQGVVVNETVFVHAVGDDVEVFAGDVHRTAVAEVAAVGQIHAHDCIPWF